MSISGYNFIKNLIQLSESKVESESIHEWEMVETIAHDNNTKEFRCICSRDLKRAFICRNKKNLKVVKMGSSCIKKILGQTTKNIDKKVKQNNIIFFQKGQYIDIHDLSQYVIDVLKEYIQTIYLSEEIIKMMELYKDHPQLQSVIRIVYENMIKRQIKEKEDRLKREKEDEEKIKRFVEEENKKKQREKEENDKKQQENEEMKQREKEDQHRRLELVVIRKKEEQQERERKEREFNFLQKKKEENERNQRKKEINKQKIQEEFIKKRKDYDSELRNNIQFEGCCSLKMNEHCNCKEPRFEQSHIYPYLHCSLCYKWKCRRI